MIESGSFVKWNPPDINQIFCEKQSHNFAEKLPLMGIMSQVDGNIGIMAYIQNGKRAQIPVLLKELIPAGVPCAE